MKWFRQYYKCWANTYEFNLSYSFLSIKKINIISRNIWLAIPQTLIDIIYLRHFSYNENIRGLFVKIYHNTNTKFVYTVLMYFVNVDVECTQKGISSKGHFCLVCLSQKKFSYGFFVLFGFLSNIVHIVDKYQKKCHCALATKVLQAY